MVPKFTNPHSLSQDVETTTRSEFFERAGFTSAVYDEASHALKRDLDNLLRDTWADALVEMSSTQKCRKATEDRQNEDGQLVFRLVSSMKHPQRISLEPKSPIHPVTRSREPDCEDDEVQAKVRKLRAQSVAVEFDSLREAAVSIRQVEPKSVKVQLADTLHLPRLLVTEAVRTMKQVKARHQSTAPSPHEPRSSCAVLPVLSVPEIRGKKKRRKLVKERPPPGYWRPSREVRGKSMGYALGYPSSWAPDRLCVRDAMKRGVEVMLCPESA